MPTFRVAKNEEMLAAAPLVEAVDPETAAASYVVSQRLEPGVYHVREETGAVTVTVSTRFVAEATMDGQNFSTVEENL